MSKRTSHSTNNSTATTPRDWLDVSSSDPASWVRARSFLSEIGDSAAGNEEYAGLSETCDMLAQLIELVENQTAPGQPPSPELQEILSYVQHGARSVVAAVHSGTDSPATFSSMVEEIQNRWGDCLQLSEAEHALDNELSQENRDSSDEVSADEDGRNEPAPNPLQLQLMLQALAEAEDTTDAENKSDSLARPDRSNQVPATDGPSADLFEDPDLRDAFLQDAGGCLAAIEQSILAMEGSNDQTDHLRRICRELHTLKGASASVGFRELANFLHEVEESIERRLTQEKPVAVEELLIAVDRVREKVSYLESGRSAESPADRQTRATSAEPRGDNPASMADYGERDGQSSVRVRSSKLDRLMDLLAELVVWRNRRDTQVGDLNHLNGELQRCTTRLRQFADPLQDAGQGLNAADGMPAQTPTNDPVNLELYEHARSRMIAEVANDLQEISRSFKEFYRPIGEENTALTHFIRQFRHEMMQLRRVPISGLFNRLQRSVRDAARAEQKQVNIQFVGHQTAIEQSLQEALYEPLLHIVRNAVSHGIESASQRQTLGKSPAGQVSVHVTSSANTLAIVVSDDGRGLDYDALRRKGYERGLLSPERAATQQEIAKLIFHPGLSTRTSATEVSGRGIGMDVAANAVDRLHGRIEVESTPGQGTSMRLSIPLRSGIEHAMVFRSAGQLFAFPMQSVSAAQLSAGTAPGSPAVLDAPRVSFARVAQLAAGEEALDERSLVLDVAGSRGGTENRVDLQVDDIVGGEEMVVRALPRELRRHPFLSGVTLSGGGEMVLTIDPNRWIEFWQASCNAVRENSPPRLAPKPAVELKRVLIVDDSLSARRSLTKRLVNYGFEIVEACDGMNALECLRNQTYQLIITDLDMPRLGGLELLGELHQRHLVETPIVVVSSRTDEPTRRRADRYGARAFLNKPVSDESLVELLRQFRLIAL